MEKGVPHCKLSVVKVLVQAGRIRFTRSALEGATALGLDVDDSIAVVGALEPSDFFKSMTTHGDHRIWQDVYKPTTFAGPIYVKLTVIEDVLVVSFKEL